MRLAAAEEQRPVEKLAQEFGELPAAGHHGRG
jgi:hypothetical protein